MKHSYMMKEKMVHGKGSADTAHENKESKKMKVAEKRRLKRGGRSS
jgi:hypothetical protein